MKKSLMLLLLAISMCASAFQASAQTLTVKGKVVDATGVGIPGASVIIQGTQTGVITEIDGSYVISAKGTDALEYSFIGMKSEVVKINNRTTVNITLVDDVTALNEVVVVGFGTQQKMTVTNAVSTMKGAELMKAPAMGVNNLLGTRVAGVVSLQQSGQPGYDEASLLVRGQSAVCIVDGIPRSINEIEPNEIESISILKDATSASVYGLNANAVILVTTKKGDAQKTRISYSGEFGVSQNTDVIRMLNAPEYAYWYNKATELDAEANGVGYTPIFTAQNVKDMLAGENGWGNTDWYSETFGTGTTVHHNVSATGGSDRVKFFSSIGYFNQVGNVKNFSFQRYNLRSNVDAKITDNLSFEMGISGRIEMRERPGYSADPNDWNNIPQQAVRALPFAPKTYERDGVVYPVSTRTNSSYVNPFAGSELTGYYKVRNTYIQSNMALNYDVPFIKGLKLKAMGAFDMMYQTGTQLSTPYMTAVANNPVAGTETLGYVITNDARGTNTTLTEGAAYSYTITGQASANYERRFGKNGVKALALAEIREDKSKAFGATGYGLDFLQMAELNYIQNKTGDGSEKMPGVSGYSGNSRVAGFVGRVNYDYDEKYLLEASVRYDGSYVFGGKRGARWVTLPGLSAGWRIHKEDWFNVPAINELKLRGSVGLTANSNIAAYQYMNLMQLSKNQVVFGGNAASMVYSSTLGNPDLTWAKVLNYDLGLDFNAWNGLLGAEIDVYYKYEYDILSSVTGSYAPSRGGYYPSYGNENKKDYTGFDLTLHHNNYIGDFNYGAKVVLSYAKRRWLYYAGDAANTPDYQKLTGKDVGLQKGYVAEGLFKDWDDVENSATVPGYRVGPGYIKYKDLNGDGKITYDQDMAYVGLNAYPKIQGSINLFAAWKGFDIDMLWQGAAGRSVSLTGTYTATGSEGIMDNTFLTKTFYHGGNSPLFLLENSWLPENPNGEFPRPSINYLSNNNGFSSTFWFRDGSYLRLKTLQIGYTFPQKWMAKAKITMLRIYVQGSNLLTFSELTKYHIDPEQPGVNNGYYPQQKTFQFGIKLTL